MIQFAIGNKTVSVYPSRSNNRPVIYLNTFAGNGREIYEALYEALQEYKCTDFTLVIVSGLDWAHDMSPWHIPPVFDNDEPCTGGADDYLQILTEYIIPKVEKGLPEAVLWRGLAGYSLGGLFAVYSLYRTDLFSRIASVSGSLWFPGFLEYVFSNKMQRKPDCLYLSLGDKEGRTKNSYLKTVQWRTEQIAEFCQKNGIDTIVQLNQGNHFQNNIQRTAAGIAWLLQKQYKMDAAEDVREKLL